MKKTLWTILIWAMLVPMDADTPKHYSDKIKQEISETLSLNQQGIQQQEQLRRQAKIQKLIPQIKEPIILWDLSQPNVAITIDDGYWVESIKYMLDFFEKNNVKATFFVIWECLKLYPELWKKAAEQWHEICNHTMHHNKYFKTWNEAERFERELLWWEKNVREVLWEEYFAKMKKEFPFFRFPWMHWIRVKAYLDILKKHGYVPIWRRHTKNPEPWNINNGDIFLWHFKNADTLNVRKNVEDVLREWKHPKTVSDIITSEEYDTPIDWTNYAKMKKEINDKKK